MSKDLRVLSGSYKRKSIKLPPKLHVRPTLVRARKMIFDIIYHHLGNDFTFLDAFAGSGVMGIEAISIGASKVVFFDNNPRVIKNIKENLENLRGTYSVIKTNTLSPPYGAAVDVVFIDPPYKQASIVSSVIKKLKKYGWINHKTLVILEIPCRNTVQIKQEFKQVKEKRISNSLFKFLYVIEESSTENSENPSKEHPSDVSDTRCGTASGTDRDLELHNDLSQHSDEELEREKTEQIGA